MPILWEREPRIERFEARRTRPVNVSAVTVAVGSSSETEDRVDSEMVPCVVSGPDLVVDAFAAWRSSSEDMES